MAAAKAPARRRAPTPPKKTRVRKRESVERYAKAIAALDAADRNVTLEFDAGAVTLTNLDKVLWPAMGELPACSRRDEMRYLLRVAQYLLPHVENRPLTLIRQPEGVTGRRFVQFHWEHALPPFVATVDIYSERNRVAEEYLLCNNVPTLLWLAHVGCLELHPWHSRIAPGRDAKDAATDFAGSLRNLEASVLSRPDYIVFDIDPYIYSGAEPAGGQPEFNVAAFEKGREVAFWLKDVLDQMSLTSFVKTSGKTGLHVLVPIVRTLTYATCRAFADTLGRHLMRAHPDTITMDQKVSKRTGRIFFDANMNARVKTLVAPYSPRGIAGAPVAMPLRWSELAKAAPSDYTMRSAADLVAARGDVWHDMLEQKQNLQRVLAGA